MAPLPLNVRFRPSAAAAQGSLVSIRVAHFCFAFYCKTEYFRSGVEGFESPTSAVQKRHHTLLGLSEAYNVPAKMHISCFAPLLSFQVIYSGCCTVAAHISTDGRMTIQPPD